MKDNRHINVIGIRGIRINTKAQPDFNQRDIIHCKLIH
jgi:hypothetical protein